MTDDDVAGGPEPWSPPLPWQATWLAATLRERDRAHHALLITGPAGLGKKILALNLAQALLCESPRPDGLACGACAGCGYVAAGSHPDLRVLDLTKRDDDGERVPTQGIAIDQVRGLTELMQVSTHRRGARVGVIAPAERMNLAASKRTAQDARGAARRHEARPRRAPARAPDADGDEPLPAYGQFFAQKVETVGFGFYLQ